MKSVSLKTLAAAILLIAYLAVLLKLIVFKYPGVHFDPEYNFIPFKTILPYLTGYPNWIVARDNLLGNIILFLPLGMLVPFLCRRTSWKHALAVGCAVSLSIEILQIVLRAGTFDVDDIVLNALGVVLGYGVFLAAKRIARTSEITSVWNIRKTWLAVIATIAVLACGFIVWKSQSPTRPTGTAYTSADEQIALAQMQADMQGVTPHFVDAMRDGRQRLTPAEQKIRDDVVALMLAGEPASSDFYSQLWIEAVGTRYILATQPIADSSYDEVIDSQTGNITNLPADLVFSIPSRNMELYIGQQAMYIYTLDQANSTLVPGSQLTGTETYNSAEADFSDLYPHYTHTDNSITINIYDTSKRDPNPALGKGATMNGKVRENTLTF